MSILTVPRAMEEKFALNLPQYHGFDQIVELPRHEVCVAFSRHIILLTLSVRVVKTKDKAQNELFKRGYL